MSRPTPDRLAIFDHDGVLVDSLALHQAAWLALGRRFGLPITEEFIHETFGMTNPAIFRRLKGDSISPEQVHALGLLKEECYRDEARDRITLIDGTQDLLIRLRSHGFALAVGTSGPRANIQLTIDVCGLDGYFQAIAALEDIQRSKPDPQVFLLAAQRAGIEPARAAVFEDAVVGIQAAKAAGMWAVGLTTTRPAAELWAAGADEVVDSLASYPVEQLATCLATR